MTTSVAPSGSSSSAATTGRCSTWFPLFVLKEEGDGFVIRPRDADHHGAVGGQGVAFESNRARSGGLHLQDVVIPTGLALEVFASLNRVVVLAVGDIAV